MEKSLLKKLIAGAALAGYILISPASVHNSTMDEIRERARQKRELQIELMEIDKAWNKYRENATFCYLDKDGLAQRLLTMNENLMRLNGEKNYQKFSDGVRKNKFENCRIAEELEGKVDEYFRLSPNVAKMRYKGFISLKKYWEITKNVHKKQSSEAINF